VVADLVAWLQVQEKPEYYPGLFTISGQEDQFYGYLYSGLYSHGVAKVMDDDTLFVFDLGEPPHYRGPNGGSMKKAP
jgi:hypothetical protein